MNCIIPKELINNDNVFIDFDLETNSVNISFSDKITTIFSYWSKEKVQRIIDDIHNELEEFFVHQPWNSITREEIYHRIFTILNQVYCYGNK